MTTSVTINAHCPDDVEVRVTITDDNADTEVFALEDGESAERSVYDSREIHVKEVAKNTGESA